MHTVRTTHQGDYTVQFVEGPPLHYFGNFFEACSFCSWLNGGETPRLSEKTWDVINARGEEVVQ